MKTKAIIYIACFAHIIAKLKMAQLEYAKSGKT
jgi:hypothetical protein